jgi:hypothetical protein
MKKNLTCLFALIFICLTINAEGRLEIEASAFVIIKQDTSKLRGQIVLINKSTEDITVLTTPDTTSLARDAKGLAVQVISQSSSPMFGHDIVPSIQQYDPVTLHPNEATGFYFAIDASSIEFKNGEKIRIQYVILEKLAERYNLWDELITAETSIKIISSNQPKN